ncbi:hypothetical protein [Fischerella sp. FACHB-380]|nr:hypothetical protein [Fischerella sp. FACHB-380]
MLYQTCHGTSVHWLVVNTNNQHTTTNNQQPTINNQQSTPNHQQ